MGLCHGSCIYNGQSLLTANKNLTYTFKQVRNIRKKFVAKLTTSLSRYDLNRAFIVVNKNVNVNELEQLFKYIDLISSYHKMSLLHYHGSDDV